MYSNPNASYTWDTVPIPFPMDFEGITHRVKEDEYEGERFTVRS